MTVATVGTSQRTIPLRRPTRPIYRLDAYRILWVRPYTPETPHRSNEWFEAEVICFHDSNFLRWQPLVFRAANNPRGWWAIDGIDRFTKSAYAVLRDAIMNEVDKLTMRSEGAAS